MNKGDGKMETEDNRQDRSPSYLSRAVHSQDVQSDQSGHEKDIKLSSSRFIKSSSLFLAQTLKNSRFGNRQMPINSIFTECLMKSWFPLDGGMLSVEFLVELGHGAFRCMGKNGEKMGDGGSPK